MRKSSIWIVCFILLCLFSGCDRQDIMPSEYSNSNELPAGTVAATDTQSEDSQFFSYKDGMQLFFEQISFEDGSVQEEKQELILTEDQWDTLMEKLAPYDKELNRDLLKSDFLNSYIVKLNDETLLQIDAECNYPNFGENITYMFVWKRSGDAVTLYGTFIDASIVAYLDYFRR